MHSWISILLSGFIIGYSHYFDTQVFLGLVSGRPFKLGPFHLAYSQDSSLFLSSGKQDVLDSFSNSPTPDLESAILQGALVPFFAEMVFRNQDLDTVCAH